MKTIIDTCKCGNKIEINYTPGKIDLTKEKKLDNGDFEVPIKMDVIKVKCNRCNKIIHYPTLKGTVLNYVKGCGGELIIK